MRVLLLCQAFPPYPRVGAVRAANLVRAFREAGHQVTVITEALPGQTPNVPEGSGPAIRVITVAPRVPYVTRLNRLWRRIRFLPAEPTEGEPVRKSGGESVPPSGWRRFLLAALSIPDEDNQLIGPFARAGSRILREGADLIYSSAPAFSLHLSARRLRRRFSVPWVAEFRDPWHHPTSLRLAGEHRLTRGLDRFLERRVLTGADAVVMVTEAARQYVAAELPEQYRSRFLVARNGVPEWSEIPQTAEPGRGPFRIVHAGSLYLGRDPAAFFEGLALYVKRSGVSPGELVIEFIGYGRDYRGASVAGMLEELGLSGFVRFEDWLPHAEVRERLLRADALLLFAQRQPLQVPNKLYEYLAARRPILAFVDREGESADILRAFPVAHLFFDGEAEPVAATLEQLRAQRSQPPSPFDLPIPASLSGRIQLQNLVAELERRFGPGQGASQARA